MKPTNKELNHFEFNPFLEYARHALFFCIPVLSTAYCSYVNMKQTQIWNPILATIENITRVGISDLDFVCMMSLPMINLVSNSIYLVSFKKDHPGINEICKLLTKINEEIGALAGVSNFTSKAKSSLLIRRCIFFFGIELVGVGMYASCWSAIILGNYSDEASLMEKILFCVSITINYGACVYPIMGVSADFVVSHLVNETKDAFDKFKLMIKSRNKVHGYGRYERNLNHSNKDAKHIFSILR